MRRIILAAAFLVALLGTRTACLGTAASMFSPITGQKLIGKNVVIVGNDLASSNGLAISCDARTGRIAWKKSFRHAVFVNGMCGSDRLVCIPTFEGEVYVLSTSTGSLEKCLVLTQRAVSEAEIACSSTHIAVSIPSIHLSESLAVFNAEDFGMIWQRTLADSYIHSIELSPSSIEIVRSSAYWKRTESGRKLEQVTLKLEDGRTISNKAVSCLRGTGSLPKPLRQWLSRTFSLRGGGYMARTRMEHSRTVWFVGKAQRRGVVYAVRGKTADVTWKREIPGLYDIVLADNILIVSSCPKESDRSKSRLIGLDAVTGKVIWQTELIGGV